MLLDLLKNKDLNENHEFDQSTFKIKLNSQKFKLFYKNKNIKKGYYPQVGITARQGISLLYKFPDSDTWYNLDSYGKRKNIAVNMKTYNIDKHIENNEPYELMIIGPILSQLKTLKIEVPDDTLIELDTSLSDRKIVVAGGIHSYGIGCTTVGMKFSNILSRNLNMSLMDLTYNNRKSYLEDINKYYEENALVSNVDVGILELDYALQDDEIVNNNLKQVVNNMLRHCDHLICWYCLPKSKLYKRAVIFDNLMEEITDKKITVLDLSFLYDEDHKDMCTSSINFINDAGNVYIYKKLKDAIMEVTKWSI